MSDEKGRPSKLGRGLEALFGEDRANLAGYGSIAQIANSKSEIMRKIEYLFLNKNKSVKIGEASKLWFEANYGHGLVKKWVKLLK